MPALAHASIILVGARVKNYTNSITPLLLFDAHGPFKILFLLCEVAAKRVVEILLVFY